MSCQELLLLHGETASEIEDKLRSDYLAVRAAVIELAKGERVVRVTVNGKATEFAQADMAQLIRLRDELSSELFSLVGRRNKYRCLRASTAKGF